MAHESSDPRTGLIAKIGVLAIVTLLVTRAGLAAYFDRMAGEESYKKIGSQKPDALLNLRADEARRLSGGAMPVDKAMQLLVVKGRMGAAPELVPSASRDVAPMQGWMQMPGEVPAALMAPEPEPSAAPSAAPAPSASAAPKAAPKPAPKHP